MTEALLFSLEDLMADLIHARRQGDVGRMALLCYCDVRHWARQAGQAELAQASSQLFTQPIPHDRQSFLNEVDEILDELKQLSQVASSHGFNPPERMHHHTQTAVHFQGHTRSSP